MAVTFKGFKIFSFRSYLWKTCLLPGSVRNIMSGTKRLTYTAAFSHDNRFVCFVHQFVARDDRPRHTRNSRHGTACPSYCRAHSTSRNKATSSRRLPRHCPARSPNSSLRPTLCDRYEASRFGRRPCTQKVSTLLKSVSVSGRPSVRLFDNF